MELELRNLVSVPLFPYSIIRTLQLLAMRSISFSTRPKWLLFRLGETALFDAAETARHEAIDFLMKHKANPNVIRNDGVNLGYMARSCPPSVCRKFVIHDQRAGKRIKETGKAEFGSPDPESRACGSCQNPGDLKFCLACLSVRYCGTVCQKQDWQGHKQQCRKITRGYLEFKVEDLDKDLVMMNNAVSSSC